MKKIEDSDTNNQNKQPGYTNGIWHWKISHAHNGDAENLNNWRNRTSNEQKTIQKSGIKEKNKRLLRRRRKFSLKLTREELRQMEQRTKKLMTMHKALHPTDDIGGLQWNKVKEDSQDLRIVLMYNMRTWGIDSK